LFSLSYFFFELAGFSFSVGRIYLFIYFREQPTNQPAAAAPGLNFSSLFRFFRRHPTSRPPAKSTTAYVTEEEERTPPHVVY